MDEMEDSLELMLGWDNDLPFGTVIVILISMSILCTDWTSLFDKRALVVIKDDLFANSLIGATIQDGGKRERSDFFLYHHVPCNKLLI